MREMGGEELEDVIAGCALLSTGGGGSVEAARRAVEEGREAGRRFRLAALTELPSDGRVATPYYCGSLGEGGPPLPGEAVHRGRETILAARALEAFLDDSFVGIVPTEIGAGNTLAAWKVAAELDLPLVDGDPAGRSVPHLEHSTYFLAGIPIHPLAVANGHGDTAVFPEVLDDRHAETLVRTLAVASGGHLGVVDHPVRVETARRALIQGSVSLAHDLGRTLREAPEDLGDRVEALRRVALVSLRFRGQALADASSEEREGFTYGEMHLGGVDAYEGETYRIWFKNENLVAWRNDQVDLTGPDLICVLGPSGPVLNPRLRRGTEVAVLGLPAAATWRTEEGRNLLGPRAFGFAFDPVLLDVPQAAGPEGGRLPGDNG